VTLSHVLEHIQNPRQAVRSVSQTISDHHGGCAYVEVPNATRYADYVFAPFQDFNTEHINHFSQTSLANLMGGAGFVLQQGGEKLVESSPNMPYPALYGFWLKSVQPPLEFATEKDDDLAVSIAKYISNSRAKMDDIEGRLQQVLVRSPQVIVWGTGQLALKLLAETSLAKAQIAAFVDGNPINQGKILGGIPVLAPEQTRGLPHPILVTTILHQLEIVEQIQQMGLPNHIVLLGSVS
jgi:hypothetical protein